MASITTFFGTQGSGGSVSGTATRVAFFGGTPGTASTTLDDSANLEWDDTNSRLSVGDATTVPSTVTIAGAGASDATSSLEVRTDGTYGNLLLFRVYNNGRIDSRMLDSSEALTTSMAIGLDAGLSLTTGVQNTFIGTNAGELNTTGQSNTFVGNSAGRSVTTRIGHTYIGSGAGAVNNSSNSNTVIGAGALGLATTGGGNVVVGLNAARTFPGSGTTANPSDGVYIGNSVEASSATPTNEIVIGSNATGGGSNTVVIGSTAILNTYLNGNVNISDGNNIALGNFIGTQIGTATTQKLAFYGDTPIVQPSTSIASAAATHGSGSAVKEDSTFGGYTIGQIVTALQTLGLLA